jgi:hypothetical protein
VAIVGQLSRLNASIGRRSSPIVASDHARRKRGDLSKGSSRIRTRHRDQASSGSFGLTPTRSAETDDVNRR